MTILGFTGIARVVGESMGVSFSSGIISWPGLVLMIVGSSMARSERARQDQIAAQEEIASQHADR